MANFTTKKSMWTTIDLVSPEMKRDWMCTESTHQEKDAFRDLPAGTFLFWPDVYDEQRVFCAPCAKKEYGVTPPLALFSGATTFALFAVDKRIKGILEKVGEKFDDVRKTLWEAADPRPDNPHAGKKTADFETARLVRAEIEKQLTEAAQLHRLVAKD